MYYELTAKVVIGGKTFHRVNAIEIIKSLKVIQDVATIKIPTTARLKRKGNLLSEVETAKAFSPGDEVEIWIGYDGELTQEFTGYVKTIKPGTPLEIECEDSVYLLKRKNLKASLRDVTLAELIDFILKGTGIELYDDVPVLRFTHFYFRDISAAKALSKLKSEYGLTIYLKGHDKLFVGITSDRDDIEVKYAYGYNVIDTDLEWISEDDVKLEIRAVNVKPDNTIIEEKVGDPDGEKRTVYFYDLDQGENLGARAKEELQKYKYEGYRGSFLAFLLPNVVPGNVIEYNDDTFEERTGKYIVDKVETTFGEGGARRKIYPGLKVSE